MTSKCTSLPALQGMAPVLFFYETPISKARAHFVSTLRSPVPALKRRQQNVTQYQVWMNEVGSTNIYDIVIIHLPWRTPSSPDYAARFLFAWKNCSTAPARMILVPHDCQSIYSVLVHRRVYSTLVSRSTGRMLGTGVLYRVRLHNGGILRSMPFEWGSVPVGAHVGFD